MDIAVGFGHSPGGQINHSSNFHITQGAVGVSPQNQNLAIAPSIGIPPRMEISTSFDKTQPHNPTPIIPTPEYRHLNKISNAAIARSSDGIVPGATADPRFRNTPRVAGTGHYTDGMSLNEFMECGLSQPLVFNSAKVPPSSSGPSIQVQQTPSRQPTREIPLSPSLSPIQQNFQAGFTANMPAPNITPGAIIHPPSAQRVGYLNQKAPLVQIGQSSRNTQPLQRGVYGQANSANIQRSIHNPQIHPWDTLPIRSQSSLTIPITMAQGFMFDLSPHFGPTLSFTQRESHRILGPVMPPNMQQMPNVQLQQHQAQILSGGYSTDMVCLPFQSKQQQEASDPNQIQFYQTPIQNNCQGTKQAPIEIPDSPSKRYIPTASNFLSAAAPNPSPQLRIYEPILGNPGTMQINNKRKITAPLKDTPEPIEKRQQIQLQQFIARPSYTHTDKRPLSTVGTVGAQVTLTKLTAQPPIYEQQPQGQRPQQTALESVKIPVHPHPPVNVQHKLQPQAVQPQPHVKQKQKLADGILASQSTPIQQKTLGSVQIPENPQPQVQHKQQLPNSIPMVQSSSMKIPAQPQPPVYGQHTQLLSDSFPAGQYTPISFKPPSQKASSETLTLHQNKLAPGIIPKTTGQKRMATEAPEGQPQPKRSLMTMSGLLDIIKAGGLKGIPVENMTVEQKEIYLKGVKQNSIYVQNGEDPKAVLAMMYKNMMQMKMPDNLSTPSQTDLAKASTTGASLVPGPTPVLLARTIGTSSIPGQAPLARTTITKASPITFQEPKASTTIPAGNVKPVAPRASDKGFEKLVQGYVSQTPVRMPEELRAEEAKNKMWVARKEAESRILAARREAENGVYLIFREQPLSSINYPAMFTKYRTFWVKREIKTWIDNLKKEYDPEKAIMSWAAERTKNRARKENVEDEEEYEAVWTRYYSEISEVADNENIVRGDKLVTSGVPIFSMITKNGGWRKSKKHKIMGKIYPGDAKGYYYTDDKGLRAACVKAPGRDAEFIHSREYIKAPNITAKTDNHLQADITMPSEPVLLPGGAWVEQVPKKERYEESQEYRNALDFRGFIKKINGKHSSPDAFAVESLTNLAPIRYWSVTHTDYVDGPARVMGAPTQLQEDIEECRRYLKMHWNERGRKCGLSGLGKEVLLRKANIKKLLAKPEVLARLLDVHRLFLWDSNGTGNFVDCRLGMLSCYGYK